MSHYLFSCKHNIDTQRFERDEILQFEALSRTLPNSDFISF